MRVQRPGVRALGVARRAAYGGGALSALAGMGYGLIRGEAVLARRAIGEPTGAPHDPSGTYGRYAGDPVRLVMLGDSSASGLGSDVPSQTPGALLAGGLARELRRPVYLEIEAVVGAQSTDLEAQVARALQSQVDIAVIMIGANDVTHRVRPGDASRHLGRAVQTLRASGAEVIVGTCPDLGTVEPLLQPLRTLAAFWSRRMATAQAEAVAENDGIAVSLGDLLASEFSEHPHLWSADRFHPSHHGYARLAEALLPAVLDRLGVITPSTSTVQDVMVAAAVASREPGLTLQPMPGGVGTAGPGRLVQLVRRFPLVGRGAPDARVPDSELGDPLPSEGDKGHSDAPSLPTPPGG